MKNIFIILILICYSHALFSQIQITKSDYYSPDVTVKKRTDSVNNIDAMLVLTNPLVFGDYDAAKQSIDEIVYLKPSDFPSNPEYASSTCAFYQPIGAMGQVLVFQTINDNEVLLDGIVIESPLNQTQKMSFVLEDKLKIAEFPVKLESALEDVGVGKHVLDVSELQPLFEGAPDMIFAAFSGKYEKVKIEVDLSINSVYDEAGDLKIEGKDILNGNFGYLREKQTFIIKVDLFLKERNKTEFKQVNECEFTPFPGLGINIGEAIKDQMGIEFPRVETRYSYNYWTKGRDGAIAELSLNETFTLVDAISLRFLIGSDIEFVETVKISSYPNPAKEKINILNAEGKKIYIFDALGQEVLSQYCESGDYSVNVSNLRNGVYILRCESNILSFVVSK